MPAAEDTAWRSAKANEMGAEPALLPGVRGSVDMSDLRQRHEAGAECAPKWESERQHLDCRCPKAARRYCATTLLQLEEYSRHLESVMSSE